jgi:RND superfamily putative drug exporter
MAVILIPFSFSVEGKLEAAVHIQGGEAQGVEEDLAQHFQSPYTHRTVLVIQGLPDPDTDAGREALTTVEEAFRSQSGVAAVMSQLDWPDEVFHGANGGTLILIGLKPVTGSEESLIPLLHARAKSVGDQLRPKYPAVKLELTGETPINFDLRKVSADDVSLAESRILPVTLLLLLLAFGGLVAALLPLGVGVLAIGMALGAASLLTGHMHLSILLQNLCSMLGLGLGIDYALLMVSRFREALEEGYDAGTAADIARAQAGHTLMISAATVAIGFAALIWVPISELRSIGVAGLLVTATSVTLCLLVLPFVLGLLGHRVNAGSIRGLRLPAWLQARTVKVEPCDHLEPPANATGIEAAARNSVIRWRRWGMAVTGRPWTALLLAGTPLLLLAIHARQIVTGLPEGDWLPKSAESVRALDSLRSMQKAGIVQSLRVILTLPPGTPPTSDAGWKAVSRLTQYLQDDKRTAEVISLPALTAMAESPGAIDSVDQAVRKGFLRNDGQATLLEVLPAPNVLDSAQITWVRELRGEDIAALTGVPGATIRVGGIPALNTDYEDVVHQRMPRVMLAVIAGSLIALLLGLRSLVAALKAVMLNLLSVGAAFGALVLVFQQGYGVWIFGLQQGVGRIFPMIPIIAFAIVFGMSMDYEVFLVARVLEERRGGLPERAAVAQGLACTAGLITSAAAIMIAVFAAFTLGNFLVVKMLGFTLAVAVLIDATIVRMIIGPALLQLCGDWNWWPLGLAGAQPAPPPACPESELQS